MLNNVRAACFVPSCAHDASLSDMWVSGWSANSMRTQMRQTKTSNHLALELENKCLNFTKHMELGRRLSRGTHRASLEYLEPSTKQPHHPWLCMDLGFYTYKLHCHPLSTCHNKINNKLNLPGDQMKLFKEEKKQRKGTSIVLLSTCTNNSVKNRSFRVARNVSRMGAEQEETVEDYYTVKEQSASLYSSLPLQTSTHAISHGVMVSPPCPCGILGIWRVLSTIAAWS
jgi:hypothetical protein